MDESVCVLRIRGRNETMNTQIQRGILHFWNETNLTLILRGMYENLNVLANSKSILKIL